MKIAIVKLSAMGDIVHAMVVLQFIKAQQPNIQIDWIVEENFAEILKNNPHINQVLTVNLKSVKQSVFNIIPEIKKAKQYAKNNYDMVIDAQGLFKSSVLAWLLGKRVVGFDAQSIREKIASLFYQETVNISYAENVIKRNIKVLCEPLHVAVNEQDIIHKAPFLFAQPLTQIHAIDKRNKNIMFVVGASTPNKMYAQEKFVEIANALTATCWIIWANNTEHDIAQYIAAHTNNSNVCKRMSLNELKAFMAQMDLVIGGDTGPTHCAWALNRPSITIFGNTPEYRNTFISPINKVIKSDSDVNPLNLDKTDFSIQQIPAQDIIVLAKQLLAP